MRAVAIDNAETLETTKRVADLYAEAVRLDPQFALAWARLAVARSQLYFNGIDLETNSGAAVKEAADRAMSLQPELGEAWLAQGVYRYRVLRDFQARSNRTKKRSGVCRTVLSCLSRWLIWNDGSGSLTLRKNIIRRPHNWIRATSASF